MTKLPKPMTAQAIFNKVAKHLLKQKKKSVNNSLTGSGCSYRGAGGLRCAIGCIIPDSLYVVSMENKSVENLIDSYPGISKLLGSNAELASDLQCIHDTSRPTEWFCLLRAAAVQYQLSYAVLHMSESFE